MAEHAYGDMKKVEPGRPEGQGHSLLHIEFEGNLGCTRLLKRERNNKTLVLWQYL